MHMLTSTLRFSRSSTGITGYPSVATPLTFTRGRFASSRKRGSLGSPLRTFGATLPDQCVVPGITLGGKARLPVASTRDRCH